MPGQIGYQDGIDAFTQRMQAAVSDSDPEVAGSAWPEKLRDTLETLKDGHNETWNPQTGLAKRVTDLEEALKGIPFVPSSTV